MQPTLQYALMFSTQAAIHACHAPGALGHAQLARTGQEAFVGTKQACSKPVHWTMWLNALSSSKAYRYGICCFQRPASPHLLPLLQVQARVDEDMRTSSKEKRGQAGIAWKQQGPGGLPLDRLARALNMGEAGNSAQCNRSNAGSDPSGHSLDAL